MSSALGALGDTALNTVGETAAFAGGTSGARALNPLATTIAQIAWALAPVLALDAGTAAAIAAENIDAYERMLEEAKQHGINEGRFRDIYGVTLTAPGTGLLIEMLRRNDEVAIDFEHGLRKAKLEPTWDKAFRNLSDVRIPGPDLAYMVVRGVVPDGGTLASHLPTHADRLMLPPQIELDTIAEAAKTGWDRERFAALVARSGLAMGPVEAARANFRGILTDNDYELTIARGDLFPGYAAAVKDVSREILTANQYTELELRGFSTRAVRVADTDKHGMSLEDSDKLYNVLGRAPSIHTVVVGLARGGKYPGTYANVPEPFRSEIQRSNIREEWAEVVYAARYNYPSGFQIRSEAKAGDIPQEETQKILEEIGWDPTWAKFFSEKWTGATPGKGDTHVAKAETQVWTALHKSYVDDATTDSLAEQDLAALGVNAASIPEVLRLWQLERAIVRRLLTPVEVRKAIGQPGRDSAWAKARLLELGYSDQDADTFLAE